MNLIVITGTTKGLGKSFMEILGSNRDNILFTINRREVSVESPHINLEMDLSKLTSSDLEEFSKKLKDLMENEISKIVFINNAFILGKLSKITELASSDIESAFHTNLLGSTLLLQRFLQITKDLEIEKRVINISSGAAKRAIDGWALYCMTKSAMEMFVDSIALEYPTFQCFNVDPGVLNTGMQKSIREFKDGATHQYFQNLYENGQLNSTEKVAQDIVEKYL